jgi:hypothetical protein
MAANNCSSMAGMVSDQISNSYSAPLTDSSQYYVPLIFQFMGGAGALTAGIRILPYIVACTVLILLQGVLLPRCPLYKPWYIVGAVCIMILGILFNRISVDTTNAYLYGVQFLLGVGVGCYLQAGHAVILGVLDMADMAYGVTFMLFAQLLGITIGPSVGGAIFTNTALQELRPLLPGIPDGEIQSALSGAAGNLINSFPMETRQAILQVSTRSIGKAYVLHYLE